MTINFITREEIINSVLDRLIEGQEIDDELYQLLTDLSRK